MTTLCSEMTGLVNSESHWLLYVVKVNSASEKVITVTNKV